MAGPLSALSPSKQNVRSMNKTQTPESSPNKLIVDDMAMDPELDVTDNEGNTTPLLPNCQSPVLGSDGDSNENEICSQGPPSSPFQESIKSEHTIQSIRDITPQANSQEEEEQKDDLLVKVDTDMSDRNMDAMQEDDVKVANLIDDDNDASHSTTPEQIDMDTKPDSDNSTIHHDVHGRDNQKASNLTILENYNENMSIVSRPNDDEDSTCTNDLIGDDTCLSTFSAVPNTDMTMFSRLRNESPLKRMRQNTPSPKKSTRDFRLADQSSQPPSTAKRSSRRRAYEEPYTGLDHSPTCSPTPGRKYARIDETTTTNLLDFTDQINTLTASRSAISKELEGLCSPSRQAYRSSPRKTAAENFRSPTKMSLLDFDIPPAPTPRSIPTITPRELESLKSSFLSQISSLKATLNGRDAEVSSLKEAVSDAERRVGEALEEVRNGETRKEELESEQLEWERRGKEMENVLRSVKSEIVEGEREKERLSKKAEDAEKCKEQLEGKMVELESQLSAARQAANAPQNSSMPIGTNLRTPEQTAQEIQEAVERAARELHTLYKGKHETKVAALKRSYEARWEKRVKEAEARHRAAVEENERLKTERDSTMSGVVPSSATAAGDATMLRENEGLEAERRVLEARIKGLEQEMSSVKRDSESLRSELKSERAEKGELVAVVDEWLAMQQEQAQQAQQQQQQQQQEQEPRQEQQKRQRQLTPPEQTRAITPPGNPVESDRAQSDTVKKPSTTPAPTATSIPTQQNDNTVSRSNIARAPPSAIRPRSIGVPTPRIPRFGAPSGHSRGNSAGEKNIAGNYGKTPAMSRSGIMSSIEKMGMGRGGN